MPRASRKATKESNSSAGRSRSATVVTGARRVVDQAPAWSQLPRWPRNITTPRPDASVARTGSSPTVRTVSVMRRSSQSGSRNESHQ